MRILGFSVPLFILLVGAYLIGAKWPGLGNKAFAAAKLG